jgi:peptidoglycan biosynthesis protein MviN/MurJ (putative lipid II flippase)
VGTFVLAKIFGYAGITAATSLAHIGFASFMLIFLTKKVPATVNVRFVWNIVMLLLIGLVTVLSAYYLKTYISGYLDSSDITGVIIKLLVLGVFVLVVYLLGVYFMGLKSVLAISLQRSPRTTDE